MLRDWGDYFFLTGSAAGGLIGLLFVIVTLGRLAARGTSVRRPAPRPGCATPCGPSM
jgi:hypothetical protein